MEAVVIPIMSGERIIARALVDEGDAELISGFRWNLSGGYAITSRRVESYGGSVPMHRMVMGLAKREGFCHHVNENKLDNRRANLEVYATASDANRQPHPRARQASVDAYEKWLAAWERGYGMWLQRQRGAA